MPKAMTRAGKAKKNRRSKKPYSLTQPQKKDVKKIVKAITAKKIETKYRVTNTDTLNLKVHEITSWNIFYYMAHGDGFDQFTGEKINWQGVKVQFFMNRPNNYPGNFDLHVAVVGSRVYKTLSNLSYVELKNPKFPNDIRFPNWDKTDGRILIHKTYRYRDIGGWVDSNNVVANGTSQYKGQFYLNMKGIEVKYNDFGANYNLEKENYYIIAWIGTNVATGNWFGEFGLQFTNYFKDA